MPPRKEPTVPESLAGQPQEIIALGMSPHPVNTLITEYDWLRLRELAALRRCTVSDVIRFALQNEIDTASTDDPRIETEALIALKFKAAKRERLQSNP